MIFFKAKACCINVSKPLTSDFFLLSTGQEEEVHDMIHYVKEVICGKSNSHANKHLSCFYINLQNISKYIFYTANE